MKQLNLLVMKNDEKNLLKKINKEYINLKNFCFEAKKEDETKAIKLNEEIFGYCLPPLRNFDSKFRVFLKNLLED